MILPTFSAVSFISLEKSDEFRERKKSKNILLKEAEIIQYVDNLSMTKITKHHKLVILSSQCFRKTSYNLKAFAQQTTERKAGNNALSRVGRKFLLNISKKKQTNTKKLYSMYKREKFNIYLIIKCPKVHEI